MGNLCAEQLARHLSVPDTRIFSAGAAGLWLFLDSVAGTPVVVAFADTRVNQQGCEFATTVNQVIFYDSGKRVMAHVTMADVLER